MEFGREPKMEMMAVVASSVAVAAGGRLLNSRKSACAAAKIFGNISIQKNSEEQQ